jgi:hypothetical protein
VYHQTKEAMLVFIFILYPARSEVEEIIGSHRISCYFTALFNQEKFGVTDKQF